MKHEEKDALLEKIKAICKAADKGEVKEDPCLCTEDGRVIHCHLTTEAADLHMSTSAPKLNGFLVEMLWHGYSFVIGCSNQNLKWYVNPTVEYLFNKCASDFTEFEVTQCRQVVEKIRVIDDNPILKEEVDQKSSWGIATTLLTQINQCDEPGGVETEMALKNLSKKHFLMSLMALVLHPWERKRPQVQSAAFGAAEKPTEY